VPCDQFVVPQHHHHHSSFDHVAEPGWTSTAASAVRPAVALRVTSPIASQVISVLKNFSCLADPHPG
jgi:hypothetical protein